MQRLIALLSMAMLAIPAPAAPPSPTLLRASLLVEVVLVFDVPDADATHAALLAAGAQVLEPPQVYVSRNRAPDGGPMQGKVFHARDPDGHLVELLEAPKPVR
jgi:hypothetical protein